MVLIFDKFCKPYHKAAAHAMEIKMGGVLVNAKDTYWCKRTPNQFLHISDNRKKFPTKKIINLKEKKYGVA